MELPFFTIGHSNRSLETFTALLTGAGIEVLVDIRTVPRSRANPQFNEDTLPGSLAGFGIAYERIAALGGLRGKSKTVARDVNGFWENDSFHNYADYALTDPFLQGLRQLVAIGRERPSAIMCSEAVWWRCHRRIVADHLIARGEKVMHIMGEGRLDAATLTPGAVLHENGSVTYPAG
ncbi:DUF488 family protein [Parapusillimonas granuli]|uniref:DUF488 domain-containing protein n=1 Tax=Parapusillimonas granuli TaxID=380911 RepID=A0A853G310_9BURK|nr:DUF488 domain-containing protein [Parapusillimonas granuli]MBB5214470.1 uncharacterized protein (DUF488 family) [Parapusillimonas granuli]MEB2398284.1 DUF488 domain-containing protein [Alcaligenaceae bacterium]NYT49121.1 DUF488 domain-containing protein [Parapusillimonas granuli]